MSEMVERVAKALLDSLEADMPQFKPFGWDGCGDQVRESHRKRARAAIEAMKVPTSAMKNAGYDFLPGENAGRIDAQHVWTAMINEALK